MMWMWDNYTADPKNVKVYTLPLRATSNQLKGLPLVVQTAQNDILRDER
jgi:acetyl esterase/lipase